MNLSIKGINHLGIPVSNIEKSKKWYSDILGFRTVFEAPPSPDGGENKVAFIKNGDFVIELYQLEQVKERSDGHIDHIAFDVEDLEATFEFVSKIEGIKIDCPVTFVPFCWDNGVKYFVILGPENERVEFCQRL